MNKNTKLYLGLAAIAVGAYLLWQQKSKDAVKVPEVKAFAGEPKEFAGSEEQNVVGDRMKMVGNFVGDNANVRSSDWLRADGDSIAPTFFDVQSSGWVRN